MPFDAQPTANYGGPLVTQKYSPLEHITLRRDTQRAECLALFTARSTLLNQHNLFPVPLTLTSQWNTRPSEVGMRPPMVVISSNRSKWVADGLANAQARLLTSGLTHFDGVADLRALNGSETTSPPIYAPERLMPAGVKVRNVYIVVQAEELNAYRQALVDAGVTGVHVVGWSFARPNERARVAMAGFGATRFAAIAFCKELRTATVAAHAAHVANAPNAPNPPAAPWQHAWLLDDNVVALTDFDTLVAVETALTTAVNAAPTTICAGLRGGTKADGRTSQKDWAIKELREGRGAAKGSLGALNPAPNILQQAVLWNIERLQLDGRNFAPIFLASGEDLSLTRYLERRGAPYLFYDGIKVVKERADSDADQAGGRAVNQARTELERGAARAAAAVQIQATNQPPVALEAFIAEQVMPAAQGAPPEMRARCQAVEQIMIEALNSNVVSAADVAPHFEIPAAQVPITQANG